MFLGMPSEFPWGDEIMLFLNVFNGALILHPEDSALLRQYAATVINTAVHFNHLFSLSGYQWVLPSMLQVSYAQEQSEGMLPSEHRVLLTESSFRSDLRKKFFL